MNVEDAELEWEYISECMSGNIASFLKANYADKWVQKLLDHIKYLERLNAD